MLTLKKKKVNQEFNFLSTEFNSMLKDSIAMEGEIFSQVNKS